MVGYFCWFLILISLRLTVFLPEQRPKCKLLTMAFILLCVSVNIETEPMRKPGQISCAMNFTNKLIKNNFSTSIHWEISKQITVEGYAPAKVQITINIIPNASFKISGRVIKLDPTKISESKYQENTISFNQLDHWQMEMLTGHNRGEALRQLLS